MRDSWDARLDRVKALAEADETARPLLLVYGDLLNLQREGFETIWQRANRLSGSLARDIAMVKECAAMMLNAVARIGPPILAEQARRWVSQGDAAVESMLWTHWRTPASRQFFGRLIVQPYAQCLALAGVSPVDREMTLADNLCPFCGGAPQVVDPSRHFAGSRRHALPRVRNLFEHMAVPCAALPALRRGRHAASRLLSFGMARSHPRRYVRFLPALSQVD